MHGNYKHRAYPFEPENISKKDKKKKKRQQHRDFRRKEKIQVQKVIDNDEDFIDPDVGYYYEI